jgi:restriction system protein
MCSFDLKFDDLLQPCLQAFHNLGGSGNNAEVEEEVIRILDLSDDEVSDIHRGNVTKLNYRLRWARNYLKRDGLLENSSRGVWSLTSAGQKTTALNQRELVARVSALDARASAPTLTDPEQDGTDEVDELKWQENLLDILKEMEPGAFERLSQRLLRELGFKNVEITGRSGDGGIDGKGILNIGSIVTFRVVFQCKRYKGSVSTGVVRDFRGAVQGRADKGLLISTGSFTRDAKIEAQRDGALAIDLMDGIELATRLKELRLGVDVEMVEEISIRREWFQNL